MKSTLGLLTLCTLLAGAGDAAAYDEKMHVFIARQALKNTDLKDQRVTPYGQPHVLALRAAIDQRARNHPDAALRAEWLRRYPTPERFDAFAEKELLLLSPAATVFGIDRIDERVLDDPLDQKVRTYLDLVVRGSREPDDDYRNRDRLAYDERRQPLRDKQGQLVAADPALLNFGKLGVLSSQAHAHYGLPDLQFSDDPDVLKSDPRRFAVASTYKKGPVLTLAAEMAQLHLDLALTAALLEQSASRELTWLHTGQAFHYLEDVSNQVHTAQVGLYDFFKDAFFARLQMSALSGGGYLRPLRSLASIGIDLITNHHVLSEFLTRKRVLEAFGGQQGPGSQAAAGLVSAPESDDPDFAAKIDQALRPLGDKPERGEFALALTRLMIEVSSHECAAVYRATRQIASPELRKEGVLLGDNEDPDRRTRPFGPATEQDYRAFYSLQERAFRRAGTALRRFIALEQRLLAESSQPEARAALRDQIIDRLLQRQLKLLKEAEARRADFLASPAAEAAPPERMPAMLAAEIAVLFILIGLIARRLRR